ncbi:MAG: hypothetical protein P8L85_11500, partial [Rubripirellula sp.]|nr:hypothetical protein [Rubripirellula sp.]
WEICPGKSVLGNLSWEICPGKSVLGNLSWEIRPNFAIRSNRKGVRHWLRKVGQGLPTGA